MASETRPLSRSCRVVLAMTIVSLGACGDLLNNDVDWNEEPFKAVENREETSFFSGTSVVTLREPHRCAHLHGRLGNLRLRWEPSGQGRVFVALMAAGPQAAGGELLNRHDIVWVWTTATKERSEVQWFEGFSPNEDTGLPDGPPPPLEDLGHARVGEGGDLYLFWLVTWAWDEARNLSHSSEARPFFFSPHDTTTVTADLDSEEACDVQEINDDRLPRETQTHADERWYCYWCRPVAKCEDADCEGYEDHELEFGCRSRTFECDFPEDDEETEDVE